MLIAIAARPVRIGSFLTSFFMKSDNDAQGEIPQ